MLKLNGGDWYRSLSSWDGMEWVCRCVLVEAESAYVFRGGGCCCSGDCFVVVRIFYLLQVAQHTKVVSIKITVGHSTVHFLHDKTDQQHRSIIPSLNLNLHSEHTQIPSTSPSTTTPLQYGFHQDRRDDRYRSIDHPRNAVSRRESPR